MIKLLILIFTAAILAGCGDSSPSQTSQPAPIPMSRPVIEFHEAAMLGNVDAILQHIAMSSNMDEGDPDGGSSPLIIAATFGHTEAAKALIRAGASLDLKNNNGVTALHMAAFLCRTEIVKALLEAGADKGVKNNDGVTPLQSVEAPLESVKNVYDELDNSLAPSGLKLDHERIKTERPRIAELLR